MKLFKLLLMTTLCSTCLQVLAEAKTTLPALKSGWYQGAVEERSVWTRYSGVPCAPNLYSLTRGDWMHFRVSTHKRGNRLQLVVRDLNTGAIYKGKVKHSANGSLRATLVSLNSASELKINSLRGELKRKDTLLSITLTDEAYDAASAQMCIASISGEVGRTGR